MEKLSGGWIELIIGPMFSGKTEELVMRLRRAIIAKQNVLVFKPIIDNRYSDKNVTSHNNSQLQAIAISNAGEIFDHLKENGKIHVIGIDEAQFFNHSLIEACEELAGKGYRIIVSGLDSDYQKKPFEPISRLIAIAEFVEKKQAICFLCGDLASFNKRISGGDRQIEVGGMDKYQATCRRCFKIIPH